MDIKLVVQRQGGPGQMFRLHSEETIIGRQKGCGVRIPSAMVSRQHCLISFKDDLLAVEDLSSANGTIVNGRKIAKREFLRPGDKLTVGPVTLLIQYQLSDAAVQRLLQEDVESEDLEAVALDDVEVVAADSEAAPAEVDLILDTDDTSPLMADDDPLGPAEGDGDPLAALRALEEGSTAKTAPPPPPKPKKKAPSPKPPMPRPAVPRPEVEELDDVEVLAPPPVPKVAASAKQAKPAKPEKPQKPAAPARAERRPGAGEATPDASMIMGHKNWELPTGEDIRDILSQIEKGKKK